ncbi:MAG: hypothetical protein GXN98_03700, partial [Euryarchaeota archaeon]|nr:hypothetical protein [Euryarchaeota archaeon]
LLAVALAVASPYWLPLLLHYHGVTPNPTQEMVYKLYAFKSAYPFTTSPDNPLMVVQDMVLNRVVSRVEGGESVGDLNNVLLFSLALLALLMPVRRQHRLLAYSFLASAVLLRLHGYLPLPTQFQPVRFTDFIEHGLVLMAALGIQNLRQRRALLLLLLGFSLSVTANFLLNPNAAAGVSSDFGRAGDEHMLVPGGSYWFITEAANSLQDAQQKYGEGVVLANPVTALYLAGLTGYKFVALPPGFSNVFVDVNSRVRVAKDVLDCRLDEAEMRTYLARYRVRYIVADPLLNSSCLERMQGLRLIYRVEVSYPNPWRKAVGNLSIYLVENPNPKYSVAEIDGIPMTYYGEQLGWQLAYHNVALVARQNFYRYMETGDERYLRKGLRLADFLISEAEPLGRDALIWRNRFPWHSYGLEAGWAGSLMQAGIIKTLLLAYLCTGNTTYLQYADRALRAFEVDVRSGGLRASRQGWVWYPEYASENPPYVLNGFITALLWLREYAVSTNSTVAERLYEQGLRSLVHFLPEYDTGRGWSYYDAQGHPASRKYHALHLQLMLQMYQATGNRIFLTYYRRWGGKNSLS